MTLTNLLDVKNSRFKLILFWSLFLSIPASEGFRFLVAKSVNTLEADNNCKENFNHRNSFFFFLFLKAKRTQTHAYANLIIVLVISFLLIYSYVNMRSKQATETKR